MCDIGLFSWAAVLIFLFSIVAVVGGVVYGIAVAASRLAKRPAHRRSCPRDRGSISALVCMVESLIDRNVVAIAQDHRFTVEAIGEQFECVPDKGPAVQSHY